jgi:iron complex outermembrane recepter protein
MRISAYFSCASVSLLALSTSAIAQEAPAPDTAKADDIVVTGTLIRGIAPGGSQAIGVNQEKIASVGAVNTSDLIASVPQAGNFLGFVGVRGSSNFSLAVNRPSLRYLGNTSASGSTTLLLLDGHRLPGMGILQSSPDLDAIAAGAIERVEIVTDGGSATYGSDAIGGVMNFVTRKKFDGIETKASVGFADEYMQYNAGLTIGKIGSTVSAYVTYDYGHHDALYGRDRDWSRNLDYVNNAGANNDCTPGSIRANGTFYNLPGLSASTLGQRCDLSEDTTFYPRETKHSVFGRVVFEPGGPASFEIAAYYVNRKNTSDGGPLFVAGGSAISSATNPFAATRLAAIPGAPTSGTYFYNFSPVLGNSSFQRTTMESYGITPSVKINIGHSWQVNAMMNYGIGKSEFTGQLLNSSPIASAISAGTFDPFNLTAAGNAAALTAALDQFQYGRAKHQMMNGRIVADGPLFDLPAGPVRIAAGVEYYWEKYTGNNSRNVTAAQLAALADRSATRSVKSVFGEINLPVFGDGVGPFYSLSLSAAGRYDDYSDFGHTFNPKLGVNFQPVEWITLRGNWGKSFQAPGISDIALSGAPNFNVIPLSVRNFADPNRPAPASRPLFVAVGGTIAPLSPQTARTWSLGFDIKPPVLEGLSAGLTYYNIDYKGVIGFPPIFNPTVYYRDFSDKNVIYTAGDAAMQAYFNQIAAQGATNTAATLATINQAGGFSAIYGVLDSRTQNLARIKTSGIDFYARYNHETGFGSVFADVSGSYILTFQQQSNPTAALVDTLTLDTSKLRLSSTVGADVGNLRAQVTWNHSQGFATTPTAVNLQQSHVGAFNVFNLFMQYKVPGDSMIAKDLAFSLNVDNIFDTDPPAFRGAGNSLFGVANGFTLGRLVKLGVSKKF